MTDLLSCNFSTTTPLYKLISTSVIMNGMKDYFEYSRSFCICGINNVYMAGVREDWVKLQEKLELLEQYDVDSELKKYISHVKVILNNFVKTFDGEPDVNWWNRIMKSP